MKKIFKWGLIGFGVLVVLGVIGAAAGGSSQPQKVGSTQTQGGTQTNSQTISSPTAQTQTFKIGDKVNLNGKTVTVNAVKPYTSGNQFLTPKSGNKFVSVDISLKNDSNDAFNYNALDFKLQDSQGYDYSMATTDVDPAISTGAIQPGQATRGFLAFEIPNTNDVSELIYTPSFFGTSQVIIQLK